MSHAVMPGSNGMPRVILSHPSGASAEVYLHGAHVTSWKPADGGERLFLSGLATFEDGKGIRGGIPVIFPQFADSGPLPKHGWLRTVEWEVDPSSERSAGIIDEAEGLGVAPRRTSVTLVTEDNHSSRALWPHGYKAALTVHLGADSLEVELMVTNTGGEAFEFTSALHSYLAIGDIVKAEIYGLHGIPYIDKTADRAERTDGDKVIRIRAETDRIYKSAPANLILVDNALDRRLLISARGFPDAVVWNPWSELATSIADMGDDDYRRFVCIEAACAVRPIVLGAGETWTGSQVFEAERTAMPGDEGELRETREKNRQT